ncbi:hypothetical protein [Succinivibrio dextrinosolvens]|uniref:hypothetical protein n=1 Tax=Succinivibrio dextrinosolvens TaxID=83771 RepID=UPI00192405C7|nr:hypothetical protein [Succinivibrio dextrinosolvens]
MKILDYVLGAYTSKTERFFYKNGYDNCIKALAYYVIDPYVDQLQKESAEIQFACEKLLRDLFDGINTAFEHKTSTSYPSLKMERFYLSYLLPNKNEYYGAIDEKDFSEINNTEDGPSQRFAKLSYSLHKSVTKSSFPIDVAIDITLKLFSLFKDGFFLPQDDKGSILEEPLIGRFGGGEIGRRLFDDPELKYGNKLGHWTVQNTNSSKRVELWTDFFSNHDLYEKIVDDLDSLLKFKE